MASPATTACVAEKATTPSTVAPATTASTVDPGVDKFFGGRGNDRLSARDGKNEVVNGGPGFDQAWVDGNDVVQGVERVYRR